MSNGDKCYKKNVAGREGREGQDGGSPPTKATLYRGFTDVRKGSPRVCGRRTWQPKLCAGSKADSDGEQQQKRARKES